MKQSHSDKVIRIQGDKLCEYLGLKQGTKIELNIIKQIASSQFGDTITIQGKSIILSMHAIGVSRILLAKIE